MNTSNDGQEIIETWSLIFWTEKVNLVNVFGEGGVR